MRVVGQDDAGWMAVDLTEVAHAIALLRLPCDLARRLVEPVRAPAEHAPGPQES